MLAYVDSSIWIARMEGQPEYQSVIQSQLKELILDGWDLCTSRAVMMETLYKHYRDENQSLITMYNKLFDKTKFLPNYASLFEDAMRIMREETLKAMDSIHVALAAHYDCQRFITTDADFRNLKTILPHWIDLSTAA